MAGISVYEPDFSEVPENDKSQKPVGLAGISVAVLKVIDAYKASIASHKSLSAWQAFLSSDVQGNAEGSLRSQKPVGLAGISVITFNHEQTMEEEIKSQKPVGLAGISVR